MERIAYYSLSTEEIKTEINDDERKVEVPATGLANQTFNLRR